jgi:succinyl-diaminopimelate desuccinylase
VGSDDALADRLAARTLELVDIASESREEDEVAAHVRELVGGRDLGDTCVVAGNPQPRVLLAGHYDTVPAQGNRPGRRDADRVHGLGASDMKGAVAVMCELALAGVDAGFLFFGREELPITETALTPVLERERPECELVVVMEPTDNDVHAGCLGNINARWSFHGRSGHSARPWQADNAIHKAARAIASLDDRDPEPRTFDGLEFVEVASVTRITGGIAGNVVPDRVDCHLNFRYAPGRSPADAEERLRSHWCAGAGEVDVAANAPSGAVSVDIPLVERLVQIAGARVLPKQAWTPVAEFTAVGLPAINFGPGSPAQAHRPDESVEIAALVRSYQALEALVAA